MLDLVNQYTHIHRTYHNLNHIAKMITNSLVFNELDFEEKTNLKLAILYHDYIHFPRSITNEEDSVRNFVKKVLVGKIKTNNPSDTIVAVSAMIMDTKDHIPRTELSKHLIDLDLWELSDMSQYNINAHLIKQEYLRVITYPVYRKGRIEWLQSMLDRKQIFYTDYCIEECFEPVARMNMKEELSKLIKESENEKE